MESELCSELIRIKPSTKERLDQIAEYRDTYNDIIDKLLNYYDAGNNE